MYVDIRVQYYLDMNNPTRGGLPTVYDVDTARATDLKLAEFSERLLESIEALLEELDLDTVVGATNVELEFFPETVWDEEGGYTLTENWCHISPDYLGSK